MTEEQIWENLRNGVMCNDWEKPFAQRHAQAVPIVKEYNDSYGQPMEQRLPILKRLLGSCGENVYIEPGFHCVFGHHISIGDDFYANIGFIILDSAEVTIGNQVYCGPRCSIYTANHALDPEERAAAGVYAKPVTIGNRVWLGGEVIVLPGVTIGDNSVVGAGAVVTKDVPPNVIAAGNPCRVIREITERDKTGYGTGRQADEKCKGGKDIK